LQTAGLTRCLIATADGFAVRKRFIVLLAFSCCNAREARLAKEVQFILMNGKNRRGRPKRSRTDDIEVSGLVVATTFTVFLW